MTDSRGSRSNSARATVSPPIPESNTPSGALFMEGDRDADAARNGLHLEIGREIAQMRGDVRLGAGEEVIEDPQHEPILHFLLLLCQVGRIDGLHVVRLLVGFQR